MFAVWQVTAPLTMACSIGLEQWTFRDGVPVHDEMRDAHLKKIRAICARQSWTRWTSIASRERLYQFISMSDESSQRTMRQDVCHHVDENGDEGTIDLIGPYGPSTSWFGQPMLDEHEHMGLQASGSSSVGRKR